MSNRPKQGCQGDGVADNLTSLTMRRICGSYVFGIIENMTGLAICFSIVLKVKLLKMTHGISSNINKHILED